jgi:hypothetical protein
MPAETRRRRRRIAGELLFLLLAETSSVFGCRA